MKRHWDDLRAAWAARQPRERRFLLALAIFLAIALILQGLWTAQNDRLRLRKRLPELRLQAETMQRQAGEIRQLQNQVRLPAAAVVEGAPLLAAANAAAKSLGLAGAQLQLEGSRKIRLRATVPFDRWLEWVALVQKESRLRLIHAQVDPGENPGTAKIDALFTLPEPV